MSTPPPDVGVARGIRALTAALLACCAAALLLGAGAAAAVAGAATARQAGTPVLTAGLTLLVLGQAGALAGAVVTGLGLRAVLLPRRTGTQADGEATEVAAARVAEVRFRTALRLALAGRLVLAGAVAGVAAWTLATPAAALGALAGGLVTAQVAVLFAVVARRLAAGSAQPNSSSIRVLPRVFGFTRARSRNSATPSSWERNSSA